MSEITNEVLAARIQGYQDLNSEEHKNIIRQFETFMCEMKEITKNHEARLKILENWQIGFMAKIGAYSAIAIILGTGLGTIGWSLIQRFLLK